MEKGEKEKALKRRVSEVDSKWNVNECINFINIFVRSRTKQQQKQQNDADDVKWKRVRMATKT